MYRFPTSGNFAILSPQNTVTTFRKKPLAKLDTDGYLLCQLQGQKAAARDSLSVTHMTILQKIQRSGNGGASSYQTGHSSKSSGTSSGTSGSKKRGGGSILGVVDWASHGALDSPYIQKLFDILHVLIVPALALGSLHGIWTSGLDLVGGVQASAGVVIATISIWMIGKAWKDCQLVGAGLSWSVITYAVCMIDEVVGAMAKGSAFAPIIYGKVLVFSWALIFTLVIITVFALPQTQAKLERLRLKIKQIRNQIRLQDEKIKDKAEEIRLRLYDNETSRLQAWIVKRMYHERKMKAMKKWAIRRLLRRTAETNARIEIGIIMKNTTSHGKDRANYLSGGTKTIGALNKSVNGVEEAKFKEIPKPSHKSSRQAGRPLSNCPGVQLIDPSGNGYERECQKNAKLKGKQLRCNNCKRHKTHMITKKGYMDIA